MKLYTLVSVLLLACLTSAAPVENNDKVVVNAEVFPKELAIYTADHDIVSLFVPLNKINFEDDSDDQSSDTEEHAVLFFALADDNGLFVFQNNKATKLLDNGRDSTADHDETKLVYFGAKDGLYVYDAVKVAAVKYGTVTDSIRQLVKAYGTDLIYILTDDHEVYKVTNEGTTKTKLDVASGAREIVIDFANNLYILSEDLTPYIVNGDEKKKVVGLPEKPTYGKLIRPPFIEDNGVYYASDDKVYTVYANGTIELSDFVLELKPTAYASDAAIILYYAHDKKIYEYNILALILSEILLPFKELLNENNDFIQSVATRSRQELRA